MTGEKFVVDIDKRECSCRKWSITTIPYCHALTAMRFLNLNGEDYLPHYFLKSTYEETYLSMIYPVNGPHLWEMTSYCDVLPPTKRILPGRPKKKRMLESWELRKDDTQVRQGGTRKMCAICRQLGHKQNNCPQAPPPQQQPNPTPSTTQQGGTQPTETQATQAHQGQPVQPTKSQPRQPLEAQQGTGSAPILPSQPQQATQSQITGSAPILPS